jgi:hypothetical protein
MMHILTCLLALFFSLSSPAMEAKVCFWHSSLAAETGGGRLVQGEFDFMKGIGEADRTTYLYQKLSADGAHLKYGVTYDPGDSLHCGGTCRWPPKNTRRRTALRNAVVGKKPTRGHATWA